MSLGKTTNNKLSINTFLSYRELNYCIMSTITTDSRNQLK